MKKKIDMKENPQYILPSNNEELKAFISKYKVDMMENVVTSIEYAIENKMNIIEIFQFKNSQFVVTLAKKEFEPNLDNIYKYCMQNEIYELCPKVTKLQKLLKKRNN